MRPRRNSSRKALRTEAQWPTLIGQEQHNSIVHGQALDSNFSCKREMSKNEAECQLSVDCVSSSSGSDFDSTDIW